MIRARRGSWKAKTVNTSRTSRWWLFLGAGVYILTALYALRTLDGSALGVLEDGLDWLVAVTPYFFVGALLGHGIDRFVAWRARDTRRALRAPDWVLGFGALWVVGAVVSILLASPISFAQGVLLAFFPVVYGVFLTSYAWSAVLGSWVSVPGVKLVVNALFATCWAIWLWYTIHDARVVLRRVLLAVILLVYFVGVTSCALHL